MTDQGTTGFRRYCKACGSRAAVRGGKLCAHCGSVLVLPDPSGLVEDEGAAVRRAFFAVADTPLQRP
ncbi:hypothetical protein ACIQU5_25480 [Streptomyces sp. NPDC090306]|uniref:hypothetical protein n=1 Tax=unclassified Streptomyces TaxID=2593676 RepID=UPI0036EE40D8